MSENFWDGKSPVSNNLWSIKLEESSLLLSRLMPFFFPLIMLCLGLSRLALDYLTSLRASSLKSTTSEPYINDFFVSKSQTSESSNIYRSNSASSYFFLISYSFKSYIWNSSSTFASSIKFYILYTSADCAYISPSSYLSYSSPLFMIS